MGNYIQVVCTFADEEEADRIINMLVDQRLVSCCQKLPVVSTYHWEGNKECSNEFMVFMKTMSALYQEVEQLILSNHSYEVPEIVAYPITYGSESYLNWIDEETQKSR